MCAALVVYLLGMEAEGLPRPVAVFFSDKQESETSPETWGREGVWRHEENQEGVKQLWKEERS